MPEAETCPWTIRWGTSSETTTRCDQEPHGAIGKHEGPGLAQFPGQRVEWLAGDRREYRGEWPGYCDKLPGAQFEGGCCLPLNHHGRCAP